MDEFVKSVFTAPVATLLIVAGILFLLIAIVGNISGRIEPGAKGRIASGVLGLTFVLIGLAMHLTQKVPQMPGPPTTSQEQIKRDQLPEPPQAPKAGETELPSEAPVSVPSTEEKEPNDHITAANLITEGATVRGSIGTKQDRDFFKIKTSGSTTRVILRKLSLPGFGARVEIYDSVENKINGKAEFGDKPVSLSFESNAGSIYFIVVTSYNYRYTGDYELIVRKE
jgi:hypothetical protein